VQDPHRLVNIYKNNVGHQDFIEFNFSYSDFEHYKKNNTVFSDVLAFALFTKALTHNGQSEIIAGNLVSANYFDVLGVQAHIGQTFLPEEDKTPNNTPAAVISYSLWQRRFNLDPEIIGNNIQVNGNFFTIVGVLPGKFRGIHWATLTTTDVWIPLNMAGWLGLSNDYAVHDDRGWLSLKGRLKPGVTVLKAEDHLKFLTEQLNQENKGASMPPHRVIIKLRPFNEIRSDQRTDRILYRVVLLLSIVAGIIMLVACVNLTSLLIAHSVKRKKEIAIRLALGANRSRIIRQVLTESMILSVIGGVLGIALAYWMIWLVSAFIPTSTIPIQFSLDTGVDVRVVAFVLSVSLLIGIICGLIPALQGIKTGLVANLAGDSSQALTMTKQLGIRHWLIIPQFTFSLLLLLLAGLFVRSIYKAQTIDVGFDPNHASMVLLDLSLHGYKESRGKELYHSLLERTRRLPVVTMASLADWPPLDEGEQRAGIYPESRSQTGNRMYIPQVVRATPGFLQTVGISLVAGRDFTERDNEASPRIALVNEAAANQLWEKQNAVGKLLRIEALHGDATGAAKGQLLEVVGVVKNTKLISIDSRPIPFLYIPFEQHYSPRMRLIAASDGEPGHIIGTLKNLVKDLDPSLTVVQSNTLIEQMLYFIYPLLVATLLSTGLGLLGLLLATLGIYGVISYTVTQSTKDFGIRLALGAPNRSIIWLVMKEVVMMMLIGIVLGELCAVAAAQSLSRFLYGISSIDLITFIAVPIVLLAAAVLACYLPVRRATMTNPADALRHE